MCSNWKKNNLTIIHFVFFWKIFEKFELVYLYVEIKYKLVRK